MININQYYVNLKFLDKEISVIIRSYMERNNIFALSVRGLLRKSMGTVVGNITCVQI